jgi:hypothetical protein
VVSARENKVYTYKHNFNKNLNPISNKLFLKLYLLVFLDVQFTDLYIELAANWRPK